MRDAVTIFDLRFGQKLTHIKKCCIDWQISWYGVFYWMKNGILVVGTIYSGINLINTTYCEK